MPGVTTDLSRQSLPAHQATPHLPQAPQGEPSYYDLSYLKPPVWKWEIASYFFLGGVSAGSYLLARMAERVGGRKYANLTNAATLTSFAALLPCAPLLIKDLGDSKRFHHMLRVWKPHTPMNFGSWVLTAFGGACTAAVLREYLKTAPAHERALLSRVTDGTLLLISDAAGVPLALMLGAYTGVLLSCTANPIWCKNSWLGPMFSASAIGTGAAATSLALSFMGTRESDPDSASHKALDLIDTLANVAETAMLTGYLKSLGPNAQPLVKGEFAPHVWLGYAGMAASEICKHLPLRGRARKWASIAGAVAGLASGYSLRWALVHAGKPSARDPRAARRTTQSGGSSAAIIQA